MYRTNFSQRVVCPRCNREYLPIGYPGALSRADNETEICSNCGLDEALRYCPPVKTWPIFEPRLVFNSTKTEIIRENLIANDRV